ncbi:MAG: hypothetical protein NDP13_04695 [Crenarchaeota archaeon]|nr:hypothetical protein [Thermoproteota archaeon]MCR8454271.1 hypothetical protein [Thermoproteota archaeon]MCR8455039.1 hypothetical protein [Thermoproteota archaeon]MCR8473361.1 hypothetical protein [Thermoproteota archaeon]MCR8487349.1 hypothetical protein [Thermoproteota archaeon]
MSNLGEKSILKNTEKEKRLVVEISAIETPRGLVPTVESLKNFVDMLNKVIARIEDVISAILDNLTRVAERLESTERMLNNVAMRVDLVLAKLSELKVRIESHSKIEANLEAKNNELRKENLRKELMSFFEK